MQNEIHIASLIVHCDTCRSNEISDLITSLPYAEVHEIDVPGKLVVLLEADNERQISEQMNSISVSTGVYSTSLVYHHHEPAEALAETINPEINK